MTWRGGNFAYGPGIGTAYSSLKDYFGFYGLNPKYVPGGFEILEREDAYKIVKMDEGHICVESKDGVKEIIGIGKNAECVRVVGHKLYEPHKVITAVGKIINTAMFPTLIVKSAFNPNDVYKISPVIDIRREVRNGQT